MYFHPSVEVGALEISGNANIGTINGVKIYQALITQASTDPPTAVILRNDLSAEPVWARGDTGAYTATLEGEFTENKTAVFATPSSGTTTAAIIHGSRASSDAILILTFDGTADGIAADALLGGAFIQIMVFS